MRTIMIEGIAYKTELDPWQVDYIWFCFEERAFLQLPKTSPVFETEVAHFFRKGWEAALLNLGPK